MEKYHFAKSPAINQPYTRSTGLTGCPHYLFTGRDDTQLIYGFLSFDLQLPNPGQHPIPALQWAAVTPAGPRAAPDVGGPHSCPPPLSHPASSRSPPHYLLRHGPE